MKAVNFSKILGQSKALRSVRLALAAPALVMTLSVAQAGTATPTTTDAAPATNWVGFTIGGAVVNGNEAGFARRSQNNGDFYGGIDSLQVTQSLGKTTTLTLDGHAMPGLEDYLGNISLTNSDIGYIKAGYKQYRTFYDGSGGYMSQLAGLYSQPAYGDELHVDRGEVSFEAGLRIENLPEITFAYKHSFRDGQKDSTSWGERNSVSSTSTTAFKFMPALWNLNERTDSFDIDVEHTLGNTDLGLGLTYEHTSYTNSQSFSRGAVNTTTNANSILNTNKQDEYTTDLFAGNVHGVTRFNDKLWLTAGFAYTTANTDTNGTIGTITRVPGSTAAGSTYTIPSGGGEVEQCVGNLNLMWSPFEDLTITPSVRIEQSSESAVAIVNKYGDPNGLPATTTAGLAYVADVNSNSTTGALDLRYSGISNFVLYAKGSWGYEEQTKWYQDVYSPTGAQPAVAAGAPSDWLRDEIQINEQDYTLGANWYPLSGLSFSVQGYYSDRDQSYAPTGLNGPGGAFTLEPAMLNHDTNTDDVNLRITWHPMSNISSVTRYDLRQTDYTNRGVKWAPTAVAGGPPTSSMLTEVESSDVSAQIISESITWSPMARLYLQGSASYTMARTSTNLQWIPDSKNSYWSGSLVCGYAIDDKTDITASYSYYGANNYTQQGYPYGVPASTTASIPNAMGFGLNTQEHTVSLALTRALTPSMIWNVRYALMSSQTTGALQDQSGGANDFTAQMISTGLQIRF